MLQGADFVVVVVLVLVLVPRPLYNSDFEDEYEDEHEYEKNQIKSHAHSLRQPAPVLQSTVFEEAIFLQMNSEAIPSFDIRHSSLIIFFPRF